MLELCTSLGQAGLSEVVGMPQHALQASTTADPCMAWVTSKRSTRQRTHAIARRTTCGKSSCLQCGRVYELEIKVFLLRVTFAGALGLLLDLHS